MAGNYVETRRARALLDGYADELASRLRGPRRRRDQILAELRDGLDHAYDDRVAEGLTEPQAAQDAITSFGTPQEVASAFAGELATGYARRTIAAYILTGPLVGLWWLLLLQPHPWRTGLTALLAAIPVLPLVVVVITAAATTLATTGRLIRWLPEAGPRGALVATTAIAGFAFLADAGVIGIYARSNLPHQPFVFFAVAASLTRMACSVITAHQARAMRRTLTDRVSTRDP